MFFSCILFYELELILCFGQLSDGAEEYIGQISDGAEEYSLSQSEVSQEWLFEIWGLAILCP